MGTALYGVQKREFWNRTLQHSLTLTPAFGETLRGEVRNALRHHDPRRDNPQTLKFRDHLSNSPLAPPTTHELTRCPAR